MKLHPRNKYYLRKILVFGIIWLFFGLLYVSLEAGLLAELTTYPATGNRYSSRDALLNVSIFTFIMGLIQGYLEVFWLNKRFSKSPFWKKILFKGTLYTVMVFLFLIMLTMVSTARFNEIHILDDKVIDHVFAFMGKFAFWSVLIYAGSILDMALFYSEIEAYLGNGILFNYLGKYHNPIKETRIFMFLDMKSSTTIAEKIGHEKYFELLKMYYADMTNAILETNGEIYQYVGDEIVITWSKKKGLQNNNCIECFRKIAEAFKGKEGVYIRRFGLMPGFKAGYHIGEVTTGEIGVLKKDIIFTGDVLNTTARIQEECNTYNSKALVSGELFDELQKENPISFKQIGELTLRGKTESIRLFSVDFSEWNAKEYHVLNS